MFDGFTSKSVETTGAVIRSAIGGSGPPLLLLHGYPQTHVMWHKIAPRRAERFTVVATDLRGGGDSSKLPGGVDHVNYSKRVMARDQVARSAVRSLPRRGGSRRDAGGASCLFRAAMRG
jgi:haloacetate dehalogenase